MADTDKNKIICFPSSGSTVLKAEFQRYESLLLNSSFFCYMLCESHNLVQSVAKGT